MARAPVLLLCLAVGASFASVPYPGKSTQSFSKDAFGPMNSLAGQSKSISRDGNSISRDEPMEGQPLPPAASQKVKDAKTHLQPLDKRKKIKNSVENYTGLRKQPVSQGKALPSGSHEEDTASISSFIQTNRIHTNRFRLEAANSISAQLHPSVYLHHNRLLAEATSKNVEPSTGQQSGGWDHLNRPGKVNPNSKLNTSFRNATRPSWLQRWPPHFSVLKNVADSTEMCLNDCRMEHEEMESYCSNEFVVNGIVHDITTIHEGTCLVTLLVNSNGLYKTNRLYLNPDGFFFSEFTC